MQMRMVAGGGTRMQSSFKYVHSCDLTSFVQIKICELEGVFRDPLLPTRELKEMFIEATVYCEGVRVGFPVSTSYSPHLENSLRKRLIHEWKQWITLPVRYCDLSKDAFVHFAIWEHLSVHTELDAFPSQSTISSRFPNHLVAQASLSLFCERGTLKRGLIDVKVTPGSKPDPWSYNENGLDWVGADLKNEEANHLTHALTIYKGQEQNKEHDEAMWLSRISIPVIERLKAKHKAALRHLFLVVEMASIRFGDSLYDVVYYEAIPELRLTSSTGPTTVEASTNIWRGGDAEIGLENLCEAKHTQMARCSGSTQNAKTLKPNTQARTRLDNLIRMPPSQPLSVEQRDLVWKFRYYLQKERRALTKFVRSVNWEIATEEQQALELINEWTPMEAEDALELLSPSITHPAVRGYAVSRLFNAASPDQILLFLPQLVQALKYEPQHDAALIHGSTHINSGLLAAATAEVDGDNFESTSLRDNALPTEHLASFLIKYALCYPKIANFLFWHLKVETEVTMNTDKNLSDMYERIAKRLLSELRSGTILTQPIAANLIGQKLFVENIQKVLMDSKAAGGDHKNKEKVLRTNLAKSKSLSDAELKGVCLPVDPSIRIEGIVPDSAMLFNSKAMPMRLSVRVKTDDGEVHKMDSHKTTSHGDSIYTFIFKQGDDLRQDQLIIQMIRLMDKILWKDNQLDLKLTSYAVLATGMTEGFVQFIKGIPLRDIYEKYTTIQDYLRTKRPSRDHPLGIEAEVLDNYLRSLAGYSVVCYILGIGDRHNDNLLLCENGKLFHVDFGYILGRDPKPLPPPMKLTSEMVQAMGGLKSKQYEEFCKHCDSAFQTLRRNANVILNLFSLMLDAGIPDIAIERDKAVHKVETRFHLDLNDEQASQFMLRIVESSQAAKMPVLVDFVHDFKQKFF